MFERRLKTLLAVMGVALVTIVGRLGQLQIVPENGIREQLASASCDLVVLDATEIANDMATLIALLREICPRVPIVVATTSPTWQRTRQAFRAGATDYARKSLDVPTVIKSLRDVLETTGGD